MPLNYIKKCCSLLFALIFIFIFENHSAQSYEDIQKKYENLDANNENAFQFLEPFILKAKREKNYEKLVQGYEDAIYYSASNDKKLAYSDSCISAAQQSFNNDLISRSYLGKGIIYYLNLKKYRPALDEYIKAYAYSKKGNNNYQKYKIIYHMGVVKSYLGYYNEALGHFNDCISYFESKIKNNSSHPNETYNNSKGYLNSLHQSIICYRNTKNFKKEDSLINVGLNFTNQFSDFPLEQAYFLKAKGISSYQQKKFNESIVLLNKAKPILKKNNDFSWISVSDFYIGKNYLELHNEDKAIAQFKKVDSIFQKHQFIVPELRENYELLIKYYKENNEHQQQLYYTKNLLKADSILTKDFTYLSAKIHKEYDTQNLIDDKNRLEQQNKWGFGTILILSMAVAFLVFVLWRYYKNEKRIRFKQSQLETQLYSRSQNTHESQPRFTISEDVSMDLQKKLEKFENEQGFLEKGLTLNKLAQSFETNSTYLSQYINDTKEMNFNKYIAMLRIHYITELIDNNHKYLKYSIQALACECGIASRQNFSDLFQEFNGIRPAEFIKRRKKDLEGNDTTSIQLSS
ncbi:AraC family transcriptional regulator [Chryseobacterium sp.]|uniref:helix-turn-helix domain-containing protein n=1 Tax=Chryseobacterium sp. TaxID=1871047 RepID=UPI0025C18065|nr:AraC family transcriptional regulator [Chryseobacterium sp.]